MKITDELVEKAFAVYETQLNDWKVLSVDAFRAALESVTPEIRRAAMEEAAKVADGYPRGLVLIGDSHVRGLHGSDVGAAIRALAAKDSP